jgi:hypothetical protein
MEDLFIYAIPVVVLIISSLLAYWLGKARNGMALGSLAVLWVCFTGLLFLAIEQASGWDGLGYAVALVGLNAPAGIGLGLGGLTGWLKSRKVMHA